MRSDSPPEACHVLPIDGLRDPHVRFFSLRDDSGGLLGVGALKRLDASQAEIKSMRTAASALGRGIGRALLDHIISAARSDGFSRISLETGNSALFAAANRLYRGAAFARCGPFGGYPDTPFTLFYTLEI